MENGHKVIQEEEQENLDWPALSKYKKDNHELKLKLQETKTKQR